MSLLEKIWKRGKDFLGVQYPVISGGMTWISTYELVKAVSDNGAFPVLAGGNMPPELFEKEVDRCITGLRHPFAVNLITIAPNFKTHYEILLKKKVPFVVFAGSFPKRHDVEGMKKAGKKTMSFASTDSIAELQIRYGVDALILEGSEAGGHIGYVSLMILLQEVLFKFHEVPVFVAGGIATGKMAAHLLLMGAAGIQMGTRFVMTEECDAHPKFKKAFIHAHARQAFASPQYDSRLHVVAVRAIKNKASEEFGKLQLNLIQQLESGEIDREKAQYEVEKFWVGSLKKAVVDGDVEHGSLMAGQSVGLMHDIKPIKVILKEFMDEAEEELKTVKKLVC
jgi:enoyl-[acyl-carrier protein] reductase II